MNATFRYWFDMNQLWPKYGQEVDAYRIGLEWAMYGESPPTTVDEWQSDTEDDYE